MDPDETHDPDWELAKASLDKSILVFEKAADELGAHMPSLATYLRLHADDLADKYPE